MKPSRSEPPSAPHQLRLALGSVKLQGMGRDAAVVDLGLDAIELADAPQPLFGDWATVAAVGRPPAIGRAGAGAWRTAPSQDWQP